MRTLLLLSLFAAAITACGPMDESDFDGADEYESQEAEAGASLAFKDVTVSVPSQVGTTDSHKLLKSAADFQAFFGTSAKAAGVDFNRQWVAYYSAGMKSGGHGAAIKSIGLSSSGKTLTITTTHTSPGVGCVNPMYMKKAEVVVSFDKPRTTPTSTKWAKADAVHDCEAPPTNTCQNVKCTATTHCEMVQVQCVRAPCPPLPQCVPNPSSCASVRCGQGTYCSDVSGAPECLNYQTCATVRCGSGLTCVDRAIQCIRAPCPPTAPVCVPR